MDSAIRFSLSKMKLARMTPAEYDDTFDNI